MMDEHRLAHDLAAQSGELLLALRERGGDPRELRNAGDRRSHEFLASQLSQLRPGDAVLSEEGRDDPARLTADRVWIVDPLDGTREFGEPDRTDWAVHVALWERGAQTAGALAAGAVALPAQGRVLSTAQPPAAPPAPAPGAPVRVLVSRTRPPAFLDRLAERIELTLIPMGSAGAKAAAVITGDADAYLHSGGQYEWDSAAPVAVAQAAGLHTSRLDGSPLVYNQADPSLPDILICPVGLAGTLLDCLRAVDCSAV
ncbi:MAG TPA: 3'(2'),5'-bisphosphate nucleotidase CysQ [Streptosporangiaceae bacterium]